VDETIVTPKDVYEALFAKSDFYHATARPSSLPLPEKSCARPSTSLQQRHPGDSGVGGGKTDDPSTSDDSDCDQDIAVAAEGSCTSSNGTINSALTKW